MRAAHIRLSPSLEPPNHWSCVLNWKIKNSIPGNNLGFTVLSSSHKPWIHNGITVDRVFTSNRKCLTGLCILHLNKDSEQVNFGFRLCSVGRDLELCSNMFLHNGRSKSLNIMPMNTLSSIIVVLPLSFKAFNSSPFIQNFPFLCVFLICVRLHLCGDSCILMTLQLVITFLPYSNWDRKVIITCLQKSIQTVWPAFPNQFIWLVSLLIHLTHNDF